LALPSALAAAAVLVALAAMLYARRVTKRLDRLTDSYWELRYEAGQLRARIARLEPPDTSEAPEPAHEPAAPAGSFIPLSSLKR
jgi:hypothetical protein